MEETRYSVDLLKLAKILLKRIWVIILATLVCAGVAYGYTQMFVQKRYTSYTTLYVVNTVDYASTVSASDLVAAQSLAEAYTKILTSNTTLSNVSNAIGNAYSMNQLKSMVSASKVEDTEILRISVVCPSRSDAKTIANLVAKEGEKEIVRIVKTGSVNVVDTACNAYLSYPNKNKNTFMGAFFGFVVSCAVILIVELADKRIKSSEQLKEISGINIIGMIPNFEGGSENE